MAEDKKAGSITTELKTEGMGFTAPVLEVETGDPSFDYQVANFLSAVDLVASFYLSERICSQEQLADALDMYAKHLREGA